jgi:hypothetical protein
LYKQLDIEIRQQIDFARILYGKGHVIDALRMLDKAKTRARKTNFDFILSEILEFQKLIEARHVTRSRQVKDKMDELVQESQDRAERNLHTGFQSNINIQIQGFYILNGHIRNEEQKERFTDFWHANRSRYLAYPTTKATFFERANSQLASMWRHYILLDIDSAREAALNCYNLFRIESEMPLRDPDFFVRTIYYINAFSFLLKDVVQTDSYATRLSVFIEEQQDFFNENSKTTALVYLGLCQLNTVLVRRDWTAATTLVDSLKKRKELQPERLPGHRRNLFRYKFAAVHFAAGHYSAALEELLDIMNSSTQSLRDDLLISTRLMQAIAYLEVEDYYLADYSIANLSRLIRRNPYAGDVHRLTVSTLRRMVKEERKDYPSILTALAAEIKAVAHDPYEAKCLRFFDVLEWIEGREK